MLIIKEGEKMPEQIRMTIIYAVLIICGIGMILPFLWMLSTSLMTQSEFNKQERLFIPKKHILNGITECKSRKLSLCKIRVQQALFTF